MKFHVKCLFVLVFVFGQISYHSVATNDACDGTVHRCPHGQVCLQYNRKSGTAARQSFKTAGICLNAENICANVHKYSGHHGDHSRRNSVGQCGFASQRDGGACTDHSQCRAVHGGIAMCCHERCVHVDNVPCVRNFLPEEDRLCDEHSWNTYYGDHLHDNSHTQTNKKCGIPGTGAIDQFVMPQLTRIIGGFQAVPNQICWQAELLFPNFMCGGTIIGSRTILTIASCVADYDTTNITVAIGALTNNITGLSGCGEVYKVKRILVHPDYDNITANNDIAILTLQRPIDLQNKPCACTLCLRDKLPAVGEVCFASGAGTEFATHQLVNDTFPDAFLTRPLKWVPMTVQDQLSQIANCPVSASQDGPLVDLSRFICAGGVVGQDTCTGEDGGPFFCYDTEKLSYYAAGMSSYGLSCAEGVPTQFTKIQAFLQWILTNSSPGDVQLS